MFTGVRTARLSSRFIMGTARPPEFGASDPARDHLGEWGTVHLQRLFGA